MIWLVDRRARASRPSASGARKLSDFADSGYLFREQVVMSGVVPLVAAMVGPGAAGTAYIPGLADFVPMVKGTSSLAIGGPYLVKSVVGEDVTEEALGGSKVHTELSGVADLECKDDRDCIQAVRDYLASSPARGREAAAAADQRSHRPARRSLLEVDPGESAPGLRREEGGQGDR